MNEITTTKFAALKQRNSITPDFTNWQPSAGETLLGEIVGGDIFVHALRSAKGNES